MTNNAFQDANALGNKITDNTKDLFFERAKWVQTWITERALPFIALLTLALSYYQIGTAKFVMPGVWSLVIAWVLLFIVAVRAGGHILQRQWNKVFSNYQICLGFLSVLLLLGDSNGEHSLVYWIVIITGFWGIGFIYPRKWLMPGEFAAVTLMLTGVVIGGEAPFSGWLIVLLMVAPLMIYLQLKHHLLKPVLFLAALIVGVMIDSNISDWQATFAVLTVLILLWVAIYSIGKLNQQEASSFIQSVGISVISGLLFVIFIALIHFPLESPLTWWAMLLTFAAISAVLYYRNGRTLFPLLMLWGIHWALITFTISWEEWIASAHFGRLYGFQVAAILGSLALHHLALKLNSNRLFVWARIYLMLVAFSTTLMFLSDDFTSVYRLLFLVAAFLLSIWIARTETFAKGSPWWKGAVNPRHVVAIRRILQKGGNFIGSVPFIGATISALIKTMQVLGKLKRDGSKMHSGDVLLIVWVIFLSIFITHFIKEFILSDQVVLTVAFNDTDTGDMEADALQTAISDAKAMITTQLSYLMVGLLFGIVALKERQPLYPLMAMVSFLLASATMIGGDFSETTFFWVISLMAAIGILCVKELNKQL